MQEETAMRNQIIRRQVQAVEESKDTEAQVSPRAAALDGFEDSKVLSLELKSTGGILQWSNRKFSRMHLL